MSKGPCLLLLFSFPSPRGLLFSHSTVLAGRLSSKGFEGCISGHLKPTVQHLQTLLKNMTFKGLIYITLGKNLPDLQRKSLGLYFITTATLKPILGLTPYYRSSSTKFISQFKSTKQVKALSPTSATLGHHIKTKTHLRLFSYLILSTGKSDKRRGKGAATRRRITIASEPQQELQEAGAISKAGSKCPFNCLSGKLTSYPYFNKAAGVTFFFRH